MTDTDFPEIARDTDPETKNGKVLVGLIVGSALFMASVVMVIVAVALLMGPRY
jgi:hypothetical protein